MAIIINPYTPGAGRRPRYLAGRDATIQDAKELIAYIAQGYPTRSVIYYGLRGVGKTVLLDEIEKIADEANVYYEHIEIAERSSFIAAIALSINKLMRRISTKESVKQYASQALGILKAFQITYNKDGELSFGLGDNVQTVVGISDTGNFQNDLTELLVSLGKLAAAGNQGVALFIDEIQYMKDSEFEALIAALHRVNQLGLPLILFAAGLPKIAKHAGDVKSYAERLFQFVKIGSLDAEAGAKALTEPARGLDVNYSEDAVRRILQLTEGYPYFIQEYGKEVWPYTMNNVIDLSAAEKAEADFHKGLDESFFQGTP
jgi:AAA+ ATPase superfamily predicted ATPase